MPDTPEHIETLLSHPRARIERIVSRGHVTPPDRPYLQPRDEWVLLLEGAARLRVEGAAERALAPGDHMLLPAGVAHWVTFTAPDRPTVWLAVHFV